MTEFKAVGLSGVTKTIQIYINSFFRKETRRIRRFFIILVFLIVFILLNKKIFFVYRKRESIAMEEECISFINEEVTKVLKLKTRKEQNRAFAEIYTRDLPLKPLKMTRANAVFLYTYPKVPVVIKRCIVNKGSDLEEDTISMSLNNDYIVKFLKSYRRSYTTNSGEKLAITWIFMEYMNHKISLDSVDRSEETIRKIATDVLKGLVYLHSKGIAHLDLKVSNIMGVKNSKGSIVYKIIDLGFARSVGSPDDENAEVEIPGKSYGTYPYKSPEVGRLNVHGLKSDIWCLGDIIWFLSLGYIPFYKSGGEKDIEKYRSFISSESRPYFYSDTSKELMDFVGLCLTYDRVDRPTATELLQHPFIKRKKLVDFDDNLYDIIESSTTYYSASRKG